MSVAIQSSSGGDGPVDIEEDDFYEMLGNPRRRHVLRHLRECGCPVSIGELAEHVAAAEHGISVAEVTHAQRKSAYTALYQNHLVKLADAGFVRADRRWVDVELTAAAADLDFDFALPEEEEIRRSTPYPAALSLFGLALVAGFFAELLSPLTVVASFGVVFVALLVLSVSPRSR
ncbi:hypothetical protein NDI76_19010 [Halogeometricum sp. S1BR25-6]|uniref:DUF7344 domain-containing protein n=1 Tax=Halogeometricum salsisoli TaxID=2950536 RepID=A0ABU2GJ27_9EURY|nr:hypothetical protein [Halogeometricum sp. S1BR25-6]MDS0300843.1 hypothetical protein [Halogeometricum sp. S1BR25-6]